MKMTFDWVAIEGQTNFANPVNSLISTKCSNMCFSSSSIALKSFFKDSGNFPSYPAIILLDFGITLSRFDNSGDLTFLDFF